MCEELSKIKEGYTCKTDKYGDGVIEEVLDNAIKCYFKNKSIVLHFENDCFYDEKNEKVNAWIFKVTPIASFTGVSHSIQKELV